MPKIHRSIITFCSQFELLFPVVRSRVVPYKGKRAVQNQAIALSVMLRSTDYLLLTSCLPGKKGVY